MDARKQWSYAFKILKENYFLSRILWPANVLVKCKDEIKSISDKQFLRKAIAYEPCFVRKLLKMFHPSVRK